MKGQFNSRSTVTSEEYQNTDISTLSNMKIFADREGRKVLDLSTLAVTEPGPYLGIPIIKPAGTDTYFGCWIRDYYYGICTGYVDSKNMLDVYKWYKQSIFMHSSGVVRVPTVIFPGGGTGSVTGIADHDNNAFLVFLAVMIYEQSRDAQWFRSELPYLDWIINNGSFDGGLIANTEDQNSAGFGFYDSIKMTGKLAFCSLLYYDAMRRVSVICARLGFTEFNFMAKADVIKANFLPTFWNGTYIKCATGLCSGQMDVGAAAYAVSLDVIEGATAIAVTNSWFNFRDDLCDPVTGMWKYTPTSYYHDATHVWEAYNQTNWEFGTYQNGGFWTVMMPYIMQAIIKIKGREVAREYIDKFYAYTESSLTFYECNPGGTRDYVQTAGALRILVDYAANRNLYTY